MVLLIFCYHHLGAVHVLYYATSNFGMGTDGILLENLACRGNEDMLINCSHSGFGVHRCSHYGDAGVVCLGGESIITYLFYL